MSFSERFTKVKKTFTSLKPKASYHKFLKNIVGTGDFGGEIRDNLLSHYVLVNFSVAQIERAGWSKLEAKYLNAAFLELKNNYSIGTEGLLTSFNSEGRITDPDVVFIESGKGNTKAFRRQGAIFKEVSARALKLLDADYSGLTGLTENQIENINRKLTVAITNKADIQGVYDALAKKKGAPGKGKGTAAELAFTRFTAGAAGGIGNIQIHAGHLEGHENFRYAAIGRLAAAAFVAGKVPDRRAINSLVERISVVAKTDRGLTHDLFNFVVGKLTSDSGYSGTKIVQKTVMELHFFNVSKAEERRQTRDLADALYKSYIKWAKEEVTVSEVTGEAHSPSIIQLVENYITQVITGGKAKTVRKPAKKTKNKSPSVKFDLVGNATATAVIPKATKRVDYSTKLKKINEQGEVGGLDLFNTKNLIDQMLALEVEKKMATAGQNDGRLRYQTGRFADSAQLLTLTKAQAEVLIGTYTYQRNPYDVFLPSGRLGTAKRDPRIYIEGAIREAAMTVLKNRFKGISLELK